MQKPWIVFFSAAVLAAGAAAQDKPAATPTTPPAPATSPADSLFHSNSEKLGYALGMQFGIGLHRQGVDLDPATFAKGFADGFSGGKTLLTEDDMRNVLRAAQAELDKQQEAIRAAKAEESKKAGDAFLEANKAKDGVVVLPSGLQYKILKAGDGKKPGADDTVVCNYRGTFIDGTEFDNSEKHDGPATFNVKGVIKGWTEALQLMPVGSKWELYVPPQLAYGENGASNVIPPNATLVFDVELLSIKDTASTGAAPADPPKDQPQQ